MSLRAIRVSSMLVKLHAWAFSGRESRSTEETSFFIKYRARGIVDTNQHNTQTMCQSSLEAHLGSASAIYRRQSQSSIGKIRCLVTVAGRPRLTCSTSLSPLPDRHMTIFASFGSVLASSTVAQTACEDSRAVRRSSGVSTSAQQRRERAMQQCFKTE